MLSLALEELRSFPPQAVFCRLWVWGPEPERLLLGSRASNREALRCSVGVSLVHVGLQQGLRTETPILPAYSLQY